MLAAEFKFLFLKDYSVEFSPLPVDNFARPE
jgi:hypothetical protein